MTGRNRKRFLSAATLLIFCWPVLFSVPDSFSAFFEKKFLVLKDQGRDILCDSYVVQKGDYVTLLLQQRGDIAYKDFPAFLDIFARLNPQVKDLDLIYPGQRIIIPLKILEPGSMEGQQTGTVTIPVITITDLPGSLKKYSQDYVVQYGDWVSKLISSRFGPYGSDDYKKGIELFKRLNPDIKDINKIKVGQTIHLPDPHVMNAPWYPALFDKHGKPAIQVGKEGSEKKKKIKKDKGKATLPEIHATVAKKEEPREKKSVKPVQPKQTRKTPRRSIVEKKRKPQSPSKKRGISRLHMVESAAKMLGAELIASGEYHFPRIGKGDLVLDLADTPVMEFGRSKKILLTPLKYLTAADQGVVRSYWKDAIIVSLPEKYTLKSLLSVIIPALYGDSVSKRYEFSERGIDFVVRGDYIFPDKSTGALVCLTLVNSRKMALPAEISKYLKNHDVIVRDWLENGNDAMPVNPMPVHISPRPVIPDIWPGDVRRLVMEVSAAMDYKYQEGVEVVFPYAGFQLKAVCDMVSGSSGLEVLVDYGNLGGDAARAIETNGFTIVLIEPGMSLDEALSRFASIFGLAVENDPVFFTAMRPRIKNTSFSVPGLLLKDLRGRGARVLISRVALPVELARYFATTGIPVIRIRE